MKKQLLSLLILSAIAVNAQSKNQLIENFRLENKKTIDKFKKITANSKSAKNVNSFDLSRLSFINDYSIGFLQEDDIRANSTSNVDYLQSGKVGGLSINGENMNIAIFDGGKVLSNHVEFTDKKNEGKFRIVDLEDGIQSLNSHATSVSGLIIAEGKSSITITSSNGKKDTITATVKGVLPLATVNHAGFATTNNGGIFEKILKYNKYISNHSYGINYGWSYKKSGSKGAGWYYPTNTKFFINDTQTFFGVYTENDVSYDKIVYEDPKFTIVKSAGNYFGLGPSDGEAKFKWNGEDDYEVFAEGDIVPKANCFNGAYCS